MNFQFKQLAAITAIEEVSGNRQLKLPRVVTGKMYVLGGQIGKINFVTFKEDTYETQLRKLALFLARMSNKFMESKIILDLPPRVIARLQTILDKQADTQDRIGYRLNKITILSHDEHDIDKPDSIHQKPIPRDILENIPEGASATIALSFGATNFRFQIVINGEVLLSTVIPTQFYELSQTEIDEIANHPTLWLLSPEENTLFLSAIELINRGEKKGNEKTLSPHHRKALRIAQIYRIQKAIDQLLKTNGIPLAMIRGLAFTSAGLINMETGVVMAENIPGFEDNIGGINIVDILQDIYQRPVISLNDVDSEIAALMRGLTVAYDYVKRGEEIPAKYAKYSYTAEKIFSSMPNTRTIITGYGGGTGIGGVQIAVYRDLQGNIKIEMLTGRFQSAGEHGHDQMDLSLREIIDAKRSALAEGIPDTFIGQIFDYIRTTTCVWCGNNFDLEKTASGVTGITLGRFLFNHYTGDTLEKYKRLIQQNHSSKLDGKTDDKSLIDVIDARDLIGMYKDGNDEATWILRIMAKFWAAHFVMTFRDGYHIWIDGEPLHLDTFFITHGMFRPGNEFFMNWVLESLKNDFTISNGEVIDYEFVFNLVFGYNDDNQSLGAEEVLKAEIERQLK